MCTYLHLNSLNMSRNNIDLRLSIAVTSSQVLEEFLLNADLCALVHSHNNNRKGQYFVIHFNYFNYLNNY